MGKKRERVEREGKKKIQITKRALKREAGGRMRFLGEADFLLTNSGSAAARLRYSEPKVAVSRRL